MASHTSRLISTFIKAPCIARGTKLQPASLLLANKSEHEFDFYLVDIYRKWRDGAGVKWRNTFLSNQREIYFCSVFSQELS